MAPAQTVWIAVAAVSALSLVGVSALVVNAPTLRRLVPLLVDFAAGALVGAACFDLIPEAWARHAGALAIAAGLVAGFAAFAGLDRLVHLVPVAPPTEESAPTTARTNSSLVVLNLAGDLLHNFVDGALVAASFLAGPALGVVATLAIALHELPRELGSFAIFLHGGVSRGRAIALNALTGVAAFAGAGATLAVGPRVESLGAVLLPVAGGTFLYLARAIVLRRPRHAIGVGLFLSGLGITALAARLA